MTHVNNIGINTLGDLLNISKARLLLLFLLQAVKNLLIAEQVENVNKLPLTEQIQLSNGQNPQFWVNERKERPANYHNELRRYKKLQRKLAKHDTQAELLRLVDSKWQQLFEKPP